MTQVTRGHGALEGLLARLRAKKATSLLPSDLDRGRILDVGCGVVPSFLLSVDFAEKVGLDHGIDRGSVHGGIRFVDFDLENGMQLPFEESTFDAVTMLAVFEHLKPARVTWVLEEVYRVLRPGGVLILTTPGGWTAPLLSLLATLRLVSPVEIDDHEASYSKAQLRTLLEESPFDGGVKVGSFELGANNWVLARR